MWAGGEIYGSHMRRKNENQNSCAVFLLFRVCEKGSNTLQPPESLFGLDQFILNEVFIRGIFIRPGLYYKGNIRLCVNPANVFPIVSEPTHVFYCKIKIKQRPCSFAVGLHPLPQTQKRFSLIFYIFCRLCGL